MDKKWQSAFSKMTYGLYVLTTRSGDIANGMIASWVTQVSYEPPLILVAVHPDRYSHSLIEQSGTFVLHVLDKSQKNLIKKFKGSDPGKKFQGIPCDHTIAKSPVMKDCLAWFELKVKECLSPGNHTLFIGEVTAAGEISSGIPLTTLDYDRVYQGKH